MGNHFGENLPVLLKLQEFPTSVGCFSRNCYKLSEHFGTTYKKFSYLHDTVEAGYFRGVYILRIREDCTHEVAMLGTWVWFSINFAKINSANRSNLEIREIRIHPRK